MKTKLILAITLLLTAACSPALYNYKVSNLRNTEDNTIYLDATGMAGNVKDAYNNASLNAFNTVLFRGVPGSVQTAPLVDDEQKAKSDHADALDCFKNFECYSKFVVSAEKLGTPPGEKNKNVVELKIKINLRALRAYLEQNKVIRSFGF